MDDLKTIIEKIYQDHNPDKISDIPNILEKYKGKEVEMLSKVSKKYSIRLEDYISVDCLRLVKAILTKYDPVNVSSAGALLAKFHGREKELLKSLGEKYNAGFNDIVISIYSTAPSKQVQSVKLEHKASVLPKIESQYPEKPTRRNFKNLIIVISAFAIVIIVVGVLYFSGVFRSSPTIDRTISNIPSANKNLETDTKTSATYNSQNSTTTEEKNIDGPISPISVTANSYMRSNGRITFLPENVSDNNLQTWWTPSPPHSDGFNSWIRLDFGQSRKVVAIEIHNGSHYPDYPKYGDLYLKNNRLFKAKLEFSNGSTQIINLQEIDAVQKVTFPMQNTTYIKLIPLEWGRGTQWNDLCISELIAIGE